MCTWVLQDLRAWRYHSACHTPSTPKPFSSCLTGRKGSGAREQQSMPLVGMNCFLFPWLTYKTSLLVASFFLVFLIQAFLGSMPGWYQEIFAKHSLFISPLLLSIVRNDMSWKDGSPLIVAFKEYHIQEGQHWLPGLIPVTQFNATHANLLLELPVLPTIPLVNSRSRV
jgi:hypothetical protein